MTSALALCNGVIQLLWLLYQLIRHVGYVSVLRIVPAYSTVYVGVTLCLQSKSADNLAVNHSTEETMSASGRLASYLYLPRFAGVR